MDRDSRRRTVPQFSSRKWPYSELANPVARRYGSGLVQGGRRAAFGWLGTTDVEGVEGSVQTGFADVLAMGSFRGSNFVAVARTEREALDTLRAGSARRTR